MEEERNKQRIRESRQLQIRRLFILDLNVETVSGSLMLCIIKPGRLQTCVRSHSWLLR